MNSRLKTPLPYYGGKTRMLQHILPRIPDHLCYCEPFVGGGAVFWSKPEADIEVLNDTSEQLINFYKVLKNDFVTLKKEVEITLHSRAQYQQSGIILAAPDLFDPIKRAWAYWVLTTQSYSKTFNGGWGFNKKDNTTSLRVTSYKNRITDEYSKRLEKVQIECRDALQIIQTWDADRTFFYLDPPYVGSDCGHYDGYTWNDYEQLLSQIEGIKGKFLLSSYPSPMLVKFVKKNSWDIFSVEQQISVSGHLTRISRKTEVLVSNFTL